MMPFKEVTVKVGPVRYRATYVEPVVTIQVERPGTWLRAGQGIWNNDQIEDFKAVLPREVIPKLEEALREKLKVA